MMYNCWDNYCKGCVLVTYCYGITFNMDMLKILCYLILLPLPLSLSPSLETETTCCYTGRAPPEALYLHTEPTKVDRSKSSLFKTEDDVEEQGGVNDRFLSVQRKDFTRCPPAGVSTATSVGYSHVLPRYSHSNIACPPVANTLSVYIVYATSCYIHY